MALRQQTLQGMVWTGTSYGVRFAVQIAIVAFLARLLTPTDFGIVAMSALLVTFLSYFRGEGIGTAIMVEKDPTQAQLSSAFWYTLAAGLVMGCIIALAAPLGVLIYGEPRVGPVFLLSGLSIALGSTAGVHGGVLSRAMRFKTLAARDIAGQLVAGVVAIALAYQGYGFYALALQSVVASAFKSVFLWIASPWRPSFLFDWGSFKGLLKFGSNVTGYQIFNYVTSNFDQFVLARVLGPTELAFYRQGGMVVRLPSKSFHQVATKVMLPALSKMQDAGKAGLAVIESCRLACAAMFLPFTAALVLAGEMVVVLYGAQWGRSAFIVQGFSLLAFPQILALNIGWLYKSRGRPDLQLRFAMVSAPVRFVAVLIGLYWGVEGVVVALIISGYGLMPLLAYPLRLAKLRWTDVLWSLRGIFLATVAAGLAMHGFRLLLRSSGVGLDAVVLVATGLAGAGVYVALIWLLDRRLWREGRTFLRDMRSARAKGAIPSYVLAHGSPEGAVASDEPRTDGAEPLVPDPARQPGGPPKPPLDP